MRRLLTRRRRLWNSISRESGNSILRFRSKQKQVWGRHPLHRSSWTSINWRHFSRWHGSAASRAQPNGASAPSRQSPRRFARWKRRLAPSCWTAAAARVAVTAAGKVFQKYAEDTIEQRRVMLITLAEMHRVPRGEIVVSANEGTCLHILPEVFAEFKRQYPSVAVSVKRSEHEKILEAIIDNSCDFGVVSMPIKDKRFTVVPIHRDELVVITPTGHPLGGRKPLAGRSAGLPVAAAEARSHARCPGVAIS